MPRFAPFARKGQQIRRTSPYIARGIIRTHAPFKFQWRPTPSFLFVYPTRNPSHTVMTHPNFTYGGASVALPGVHGKRNAVLRRKLRKKPRKKLLKARRVRFSRSSKRR